jgi:hypothetical protein
MHTVPVTPVYTPSGLSLNSNASLPLHLELIQKLLIRPIRQRRNRASHLHTRTEDSQAECFKLVLEGGSPVPQEVGQRAFMQLVRSHLTSQAGNITQRAFPVIYVGYDTEGSGDDASNEPYTSTLRII